MTARLSTEIETTEAILEGARTDECGTIARGEFDTHRNCVHLEQSFRDVDADDVACYAHSLDLDSIIEVRMARIEMAYLDAQFEGMERWRQ